MENVYTVPKYHDDGQENKFYIFMSRCLKILLQEGLVRAPEEIQNDKISVSEATITLVMDRFPDEFGVFLRCNPDEL